MVVTASSGGVVEVFRNSIVQGSCVVRAVALINCGVGPLVRGLFSAPAEARLMPAQSLLPRAGTPRREPPQRDPQESQEAHGTATHASSPRACGGVVPSQR
jgi:hypothetical protein